MKQSLKLAIVSAIHIIWIAISVIYPTFWENEIGEYYHFLVVSSVFNFMQVIAFLDNSVIPNHQAFTFSSFNYGKNLVIRLLVYFRYGFFLIGLYIITIYFHSNEPKIIIALTSITIFVQIAIAFLALVVWDYCIAKRIKEVLAIPFLLIFSIQLIKAPGLLNIDNLGRVLIEIGLVSFFITIIVILISKKFNRNWF